MTERRCYVLPLGSDFPADCILKEVKSVIQKQEGQEPVTLRGCNLLQCKGDTILDFFVKLFRKHGLHKNERVTLLSTVDQSIALQLVLADLQKETKDDTDLDTQTVLTVEGEIIQHKVNPTDTPLSQHMEAVFQRYEEFLTKGNYCDSCDVVNSVQKELSTNQLVSKDVFNNNYLILLDKTGVTQPELKLLKLFGEIHKVIVRELPHSLNESCSVEVSTADQPLSVILQQLNNTTHTDYTSPQKSATETYVHSAVLSYLELVVNSRSELALARVLNIPNRGLNHTAFTDLKHYSSSLNMPMYQACLSFITRLRLGGKGYAPKSDCQLAQHVKGIGEFSDLMQKIQTVVEESGNFSSACKRVLHILKIAILKDKENRLRRSSIEAAIEKIKGQFEDLFPLLDSTNLTTPDKPAGLGGTMLGRTNIKVLRMYLDHEACQTTSSHSGLSDVFSSQKTPVHFPSILSKFRSPIEEVVEEDPVDVKMKKSKRKANDNPNPQVKRSRNEVTWGRFGSPVRDVQVYSTNSPYIVLPSKTLMHPGKNTVIEKPNKIAVSLNDQENIVEPLKGSNDCVVQETEKQPQPSTKPANEMTQSQPPAKKTNVLKGKNKKSVRRKLIPQIKGQQSLTKFFRV